MNDLGVILHEHNGHPTFLDAAKALYAKAGRIEIHPNYLVPGFLPGFGMRQVDSPVLGVGRDPPRFSDPEMTAYLRWGHDFEGSIEQYADLARERLVSHLRQHWDASRPTLVLHSNGYDSRILSSCLAAMRDTGFDLGALHFRCHAPEGASFIQIMRRQGWDPDQYSVFAFPPMDLFDVPNWERPGTSPWLPTTTLANFWRDIVPASREKDWNLVCGVGGGEFCEYPALGKSAFVDWTYCANGPVQLWLSYFIDCTDWIGDMERRFHKVLFPYFGTEHLRTVSELPNRFLGLERNGCDNVRAAILRTFDDSLLDLPRVLRSYDWFISAARWREVRDRYAESAFCARVPGAPSPPTLLKRMQSTFFDQTDNTAERLWRLASLWETIVAPKETSR